jgi:hypothetical protein
MVCRVEHCRVLCYFALCSGDKSALARRVGPRYLLHLPFNPGYTHTYLVFSVPTYTHAAYQIKALPHNIKKYIFRMKVDPLPPLYEHEGAIGEKHYAPGGAGHA